MSQSRSKLTTQPDPDPPPHHEVDDDDLDPKKTHTPPDAPKPGVIFDENEEAR